MFKMNTGLRLFGQLHAKYPLHPLYQTLYLFFYILISSDPRFPSAKHFFKMKGKQELAKIEIKLSLLFNAKISGLSRNLSCSSLFLQEKIGHNMFIVSRYARRCDSICIRLSEKKRRKEERNRPK